MSTVFYKDYFTEEEAAEYCCVSYSHFRKHKHNAGINAGVFMGKLVYRRADLQRAIEKGAFKEWPRPTNITEAGISSGRRTARGIKKTSVVVPLSPQSKQD